MTAERPYTVHTMHEGLPDQMYRLMVNRGMRPTLGLRFLAMDLANLAATGEGKFVEDLLPLDADGQSVLRAQAGS